MKLFVKLSTLAILALASTNAKAQDNNIEGYWLTQNERAVIKIAPCESSICGSIYWIIDGGLQKDIHNEDETLRDRPMCGLQILGNFEKESATEWEDGFIYKADDGDIYDANLELISENKLKLRGYVGVPLLGKTQHWTRVSKDDYKACK